MARRFLSYQRCYRARSNQVTLKLLALKLPPKAAPAWPAFLKHRSAWADVKWCEVMCFQRVSVSLYWTRSKFLCNIFGISLVLNAWIKLHRADLHTIWTLAICLHDFKNYDYCSEHKNDIRLICDSFFPAALQKKRAAWTFGSNCQLPVKRFRAVPSWSPLGDGSLVMALVISDALKLLPCRPVSATSKEAEWLPQAFSRKHFNDLQWFSMIFNDLQWFSMTFNDLQWSSMGFIDTDLQHRCSIAFFNFFP